ncbi:MAG TPA: hypothetical protein G4O06_03900 [Dehalococcoidia bacterium]|nr:hypothetical protein [Dehalococcoidia bacterium]
MKRIQAPIIAGLLLFTLILPQFVLAQPVISDVDAVDITATTAAITWITSENATSEVQYGTTTVLGNTESDSSMVLDHYVPLTGLDPDTLYYYAVWADGVRSPADNDEYHSFTTTKLPEEYSITLDHACGVCGELVEAGICGEIIEVTAIVGAAGTYHICWDSRTEASVVETFTATAAGIYTVTFFMPEDTKGSHNVYLVNNTYADPATNTFATFEVLPSVKTDLREGPVGTEVTIDGYGFSNGQDIRVSLYQGGAKKGVDKTADANSQGSWTVLYTIPDTPAGGYILKIEGEEGTIWVGWVNKDFEVTPQITTSTDAGTVGQTIEISGTGFASEEEDVEITFDGEVVQTNSPIVADDSGSWEAMIRVPSLQRGTYTVDASGESTRARDVPDIEFIVGAGVWVEPGLAYVGDAITVTGGGFAPEETGVRVTFAGTVVATNIPVDSNGSWTSSFDLQASTYGSHTVSASGDTTSSVTTTLNTQAQITELSPAEGSPGDSITLEGNGFNSSQALTVTIGGIAASGNLQTQSNGNFNISFRVPRGSPEGEQTLVVTDEGGATDSIDFTVTEKILSTTPLPISPQDNTLRSGEVTFNWQGETGSTTYTYTIEVNTTASSGNIWSKSGIAESSYTLTEGETLPKNNYYWRVKIVDDYGNEGPWSDYVEFRVSPIPTWVWVVIGLVVLVVLMVVAYRETKFRVAE